MPPRLTVSEVQQSACQNESFLLTLVGDKSFSLITEPLIAAIPCLVRKGQKLSRLGAALNSLSVLVVHIFCFVFLPNSYEKRRNSFKLENFTPFSKYLDCFLFSMQERQGFWAAVELPPSGAQSYHVGLRGRVALRGGKWQRQEPSESGLSAEDADVTSLFMLLQLTVDLCKMTGQSFRFHSFREDDLS